MYIRSQFAETILYLKFIFQNSCNIYATGIEQNKIKGCVMLFYPSIHHLKKWTFNWPLFTPQTQNHKRTVFLIRLKKIHPKKLFTNTIVDLEAEMARTSNRNGIISTIIKTTTKWIMVRKTRTGTGWVQIVVILDKV